MKRFSVWVIGFTLIALRLVPFLPHDHGLHAPYTVPFCNKCTLLKTLPLEMPDALMIVHSLREQFTDFRFLPIVFYGNIPDSTETRAPPSLI